MARPDPSLATLAADLALAVGERGVVCLGCPVDCLPGVDIPLLLAEPPLRSMPLSCSRLLIAVLQLPGDSAESLLALAQAAVPEVWRLDDESRLLERFSRPLAGRYRRRELLLPGEPVSLASLGVVTVRY